MDVSVAACHPSRRGTQYTPPPGLREEVGQENCAAAVRVLKEESSEIMDDTQRLGCSSVPVKLVGQSRGEQREEAKLFSSAY